MCSTDTFFKKVICTIFSLYMRTLMPNVTIVEGDGLYKLAPFRQGGGKGEKKYFWSQIIHVNLCRSRWRLRAYIELLPFRIGI